VSAPRIDFGCVRQSTNGRAVFLSVVRDQNSHLKLCEEGGQTGAMLDIFAHTPACRGDEQMHHLQGCQPGRVLHANAPRDPQSMWLTSPPTMADACTANGLKPAPRTKCALRNAPFGRDSLASGARQDHSGFLTVLFLNIEASAPEIQILDSEKSRMPKPSLVRPFDRHAGTRVRTAMEDTRIVALVGPRQSGKTTLARQIAADRGLAFVTLDDDQSRQFAIEDPDGFVRDLDRAVIDEIQRAPRLILALKKSVDEDLRPGRS